MNQKKPCWARLSLKTTELFIFPNSLSKDPPPNLYWPYRPYSFIPLTSYKFHMFMPALSHDKPWRISFLHNDSRRAFSFFRRHQTASPKDSSAVFVHHDESDIVDCNQFQIFHSNSADFFNFSPKIAGFPLSDTLNWMKCSMFGSLSSFTAKYSPGISSASVKVQKHVRIFLVKIIFFLI